jgi:hypothetical protein
MRKFGHHLWADGTVCVTVLFSIIVIANNVAQTSSQTLLALQMHLLGLGLGRISAAANQLHGGVLWQHMTGPSGMGEQPSLLLPTKPTMNLGVVLFAEEE